jgi:hypothetical protein
MAMTDQDSERAEDFAGENFPLSVVFDSIDNRRDEFGGSMNSADQPKQLTEAGVVGKASEPQRNFFEISV